MVIVIIIMDVAVMNVFSGRFGAKIDAVYTVQNRKDALGVVARSSTPVTIIVDESYTSAWQSNTISQNWDILVYGEAGSVLEDPKCVGGTIEFNGRKLRIEAHAIAPNQRSGQTAHIELGCSRL